MKKLSKDINSGDYNPFFTGKPLTADEMKDMGFTRGVFKMNSNGYYVWIYYTDICPCGKIGCISTKTTGFDDEDDEWFKNLGVVQNWFSDEI